MTEWGVFLVIGSVVSFLACVISPITKLTQSITKLSVVVDQLTKDMETSKQQSEKSHEELWEHVHGNDAKLADHEMRIRIMEHHE